MLKIICETRLKESINIPCEGIFWIINDTLIVFKDPVNTPHSVASDLTHINTWKSVKHNYRVGGKLVKYDYFPRGRVMILPIHKDGGIFDYYDVTVYIDKYIDTVDNRETIEDEFRLYLKTCKVSYEGQLGLDGSHYNCPNCKS